MTSPTASESSREKFYTDKAKAEIRAAVAKRAERGNLIKQGVAFSVGIIALAYGLSWIYDRSLADSPWVFVLASIPALQAIAFYLWSNEKIDPADEAAEARLAEIFAAEERTQIATQRAKLLADYRAEGQ